jgi:hypothetical protein
MLEFKDLHPRFRLETLVAPKPGEGGRNQEFETRVLALIRRNPTGSGRRRLWSAVVLYRFSDRSGPAHYGNHSTEADAARPVADEVTRRTIQERSAVSAKRCQLAALYPTLSDGTRHGSAGAAAPPPTICVGGREPNLQKQKIFSQA